MKSFLLLITTILLVACTTPKVRFSEANNQEFEPYTGEVRLLDRLPEKKTYTVIGKLDAEAYMTNPNDQVIYAMKREAAKHGANAIVLRGEIVAKLNLSFKTAVGMYDPSKTASATAIRVD